MSDSDVTTTKDAVRRWLDHLGRPGATEPYAGQVICHDPSGTRVLTSLADERSLRQLLEPGIVGPVERSYSMIADGDLVALLGMARTRDRSQTSHWVQLCRVCDWIVCESWISGSAQNVDWGPLPEQPRAGRGVEQADKRLVQRWWDEMYGEQRFEELMPELAGPEYIRHEATGSWTTSIREHLQRINSLYTAGKRREPLRISYALAAEGDRVAGWGTMRGYRGGETKDDSVNSFVQMFRVAGGRLVETWTAGWAVGVDWTS